MSKRIKILTPRIYEHSDFFHNAYDFARKKSLNTNELCLELSHYLVEHFDKVWKIERPRIYKQICNLQSQLQQANEIINNPDTLIFQQQQLIGSLQSQLTEKEKEIENWQTMYESVVQTCHNDKEEIERLNKQLAEKEKEKEKSLSIKSVVRTLMKDNNLNCTFRDKTNAQIQQCGDVYNSNYGYFNFEDDYDESLNNKNDNRFDITSIDLTDQDKISFAVEQLEKVKNKIESKVESIYKILDDLNIKIVGESTSRELNAYEEIAKDIDNQIKQLKEGK